jgi:MoxR-like ATPase
VSPDELTAATDVAERFLDNIETVVHGKREQIKLVVAALMCSGHALLEDVPGTAKTVLARAISGSIEDARSTRIQCTPDLQPTDVTGLSIFNQRERDFEFRLDRFLVKTALGYPDAEDEARIVEEQLGGHPLGRLEPVIDLKDIATLRAAVGTVFVHEAVARWTVDLVRATRTLDLVAIGASVRGTLALNRMARAWALLQGRRYVTPDDIEQLFVPVLLHRILFRPSFLAEIRDRGWDAAADEVRQRCLVVAPKPGFDIDLDVPAAASA